MAPGNKAPEGIRVLGGEVLQRAVDEVLGVGLLPGGGAEGLDQRGILVSLLLLHRLVGLGEPLCPQLDILEPLGSLRDLGRRGKTLRSLLALLRNSLSLNLLLALHIDARRKSERDEVPVVDVPHPVVVGVIQQRREDSNDELVLVSLCWRLARSNAP